MGIRQINDHLFHGEMRATKERSSRSCGGTEKGPQTQTRKRREVLRAGDL